MTGTIHLPAGDAYGGFPFCVGYDPGDGKPFIDDTGFFQDMFLMRQMEAMGFDDDADRSHFLSRGRHFLNGEEYDQTRIRMQKQLYKCASYLNRIYRSRRKRKK